MTRKEAWAYYSKANHRVPPEVFLDIFRTVYDAVEYDASVEKIAPVLFRQLEAR